MTIILDGHLITNLNRTFMNPILLVGDRLANKARRRHNGGLAMEVLTYFVELRRDILHDNDPDMSEALSKGWLHKGVVQFENGKSIDIFLTRHKGRLLCRLILPMGTYRPAILIDSDFDTVHEKILRLLYSYDH